MFDVLDETHEDVVAIRAGRGTRRCYEELYSLLISKTEQFGAVHVLEQAPNWTFRTFLSHLHGVVPDLRYGGTFRIGRYAAVGDSIWARLLFDWWRAVRPVWPVAPETMRYFEMENRGAALRWVGGDQ
jgi:hypothetical protein